MNKRFARKCDEICRRKTRGSSPGIDRKNEESGELSARKGGGKN